MKKNVKKDIYRFLAIDLGAESGRGIVAELSGGKVRLEEIHRFANRSVRLGGTLYWDFPYLFAEIIACMKVCREREIDLDAIGVDTWGVDFGLLDANDELLANPVHYRDGRTENIFAYSDNLMTREEIYISTGYGMPWPLDTLFQLAAMQRDNSAILKSARTMLNIPDLINFFLTGEKMNELSIANTANLISTDCKWSAEVIRAFGLRRGMFGKITKPAKIIGPLTEEIQKATGLGDVPVIAVCGHDTSSAVAAVPAEGDNWAYISCGTWSIIGAEVEKPIATPRALELGFANQITVGGWYLARNVLGLWLVQELKRKWDKAEDAWDYDRITAEAEKAQSGPLINAADAELFAPDDMEETILKLIGDCKMELPQSKGQIVRCVLESLALEYNLHLKEIEKLTGRKIEALYMVGGGIKNELLCRFTAEACGIPVHAGIDQCTAVGNAMAQALAVKAITGRKSIRKISAKSFEIKTYLPENQQQWASKREIYQKLHRQ